MQSEKCICSEQHTLLSQTTTFGKALFRKSTGQMVQGMITAVNMCFLFTDHPHDFMYTLLIDLFNDNRCMLTARLSRFACVISIILDLISFKNHPIFTDVAPQISKFTHFFHLCFLNINLALVPSHDSHEANHLH